MASHMLHEVQEVCDSIALVDKGKLLVYDRIENLENIFRANKIQVELLQPPPPLLIAKMEKLQNVRAVTVEGKKLTIDFAGDEAQQAQLLAALVKDQAVSVVSFRGAVEALEEVYLQLVKEGN